MSSYARTYLTVYGIVALWCGYLCIIGAETHLACVAHIFPLVSPDTPTTTTEHMEYGNTIAVAAAGRGGAVASRDNLHAAAEEELTGEEKEGKPRSPQRASSGRIFAAAEKAAARELAQEVPFSARLSYF